MGWFCFSIFDNLKTIISYYQWGNFRISCSLKAPILCFYLFLFVSKWLCSTEEQQYILLEAMEYNDATLSLAQAIKMKKLMQESKPYVPADMHIEVNEIKIIMG